MKVERTRNIRIINIKGSTVNYKHNILLLENDTSDYNKEQYSAAEHPVKTRTPAVNTGTNVSEAP